MRRHIKVVLVVLNILLIVVAASSLRWRFEHDAPIMLYIGFMMDRHDSLPYKDVFDMNFPGTYLAYYLIGKLSGYGDVRVRCIDLAILAAIMAVTWLWMKRLAPLAAWCGCVFWGLVYLGLGPQISIQREYLLLLPVAAGVCVAVLGEGWRPSYRNLAVGLLFGVAATIKPHAAVGYPMILWYEYRRAARSETSKASPLANFLKPRLLPGLVGLVLPFAAALAYLQATGALAAFFDMVRNYLPLYTQLTEIHRTLDGESRARYLLDMYRTIHGVGILVAAAAVGAYVSLFSSNLGREARRQVLLLVGLAFSYSTYPIFAGKFWTYHWLPFLYFILLVSSLCLVDQPQGDPRGKRLFPVVVLALVLLAALPSALLDYALVGRALPPPKGGRVDEIAAFLERNLRPGDTVQPLDWTGGAVHAMLEAEAKIATPFVYDFHFYHHFDEAYVQALRRRFIDDLERSRPRFIVAVLGSDKPWVSGARTTREFHELETLVETNYGIASRGKDYVILEARPVAPSPHRAPGPLPQ